MTPGADQQRWPRFARLALKELREILRDRRTVLTLVLMPLLVYPLLGVTFQKFVVTQFSALGPAEFLIAFDSPRGAEVFRGAYSRGNQLLGRETQPGEQPPPARPGEPPEPQLRFLIPESRETAPDLDELVLNQSADLGVRVRRTKDRHSWKFELLTQGGSAVGREAREHVESRLRAVNEAFVTQFLRQQPQPVSLPFAWESTTLASAPSGPAFSLATIVPLILILMTVTGAVYPAIDLTAGERERGTLEALISAPVPRQQVLCAKYVAVFFVALLTAVANLVAMTSTAFATGLEKVLFGEAGLSLTLLLQIFGLLSVFAGFFSAVILMVTSLARSFKEAQAYLIPLMLLSLAPGICALLPGLKMTAFLAVAPLVNIVLVTRDLLAGRAVAGLVTVALASTAGYTALALMAAARLFGTDAVLYGSSGSWRDLWRRPTERQAAPSLNEGLIALAGLFPAFVLLGGVPARMTDVALSWRLAASAAVTLLLFVVWPIGLALHSRLRLSSGCGLTTASPWAYAGALLWGISLWPFAYEIEVLTLSAERLQHLVELFRPLEQELRAIPLPWKLCTLALIPAACEEFFFRGYLFRAFRTVLTPWPTILLTALLFGLFHVLVRDALLLERFLPTALMGVALGWVAHRTGSTAPGILLHVLHNGLVLGMAPAVEWVVGGRFDYGSAHLPAWALMIALIVACAGGALLYTSSVGRGARG